MKTSSPIIACLQDPPDAVNDRDFVGLHPGMQGFAAANCQEPGRTAMQMKGSPVVILCPSFFEQRPEPPTRACPSVVGATNQFKQWGVGIISTQVFVLLHEILHVYIGGVIDPDVIPGEWYGLQPCFDNDAGYASHNPGNYVFFVHNEFRIPCWPKVESDVLTWSGPSLSA